MPNQLRRKAGKHPQLTQEGYSATKRDGPPGSVGKIHEAHLHREYSTFYNIDNSAFRESLAQAFQIQNPNPRRISSSVQIGGFIDKLLICLSRHAAGRIVVEATLSA